MRSFLVAAALLLSACASSSYLEPLASEAPDATPDVMVAAPQPDAVARETAADVDAGAQREVAAVVEDAADAQREAAAEVAPEATVDATPEALAADAGADAPDADAAPEAAAEAGLALSGEWCGASRACAAEGLPWNQNGTACFTDIAPVAYVIGEKPILTYCAKRCLVDDSECIGWGGGCCRTVVFQSGVEGNACVSPENCK